MGTARRILIAGAGALTILAGPATASAAVFNVNTTADGPDTNTADTACDADSLAAGEQCTLRAALEQSNTTPSPPHTINLPAGTYTVDSAMFAELVVDTDVIVDGAGASTTIIRQQVAGRVILVDVGDSLDLRDVTVRDGVLAAEGAGIQNNGTLILSRSRVLNNQTIASDGGGIYANGTAVRTEIRDSVIGAPGDPNVAGGAGPGTEAGRGGGIAVLGGNLVVRGSLIEANEANNETPSNNNGGGIFVFTGASSGTDSITDTVLRGNKANQGSGGAISYSVFSGAITRIEDVTVSDNHADTCGGGMIIGGADVDLVNVTISGNTAANSGGGVCGGNISIEHSTIAGNDGNGLGDGIRTTGGTTTVGASILANGPADCIVDPGSTLTSGGFNLESGTSCGFTSGGDAQNANAALGPLADNGGPTPTRALLPASQAIDRVAAGCPGPPADQRGVPRPQGARCDGGAYELARCNGVVVNRVGTPGNDSITGTGAADGFLLFAGTNAASGGAGNDSACGGAGADSFDGGPGADTLLGAGGANRLIGRAGRDLLLGGSAIDILLGGGGADRGLGGGGGDRLKGQAGNDRLSGQSGRDRLLGGGGRDRLKGGPGRDLLKGGPGRDLLRGGPGPDRQRQ